MDVISPLIVEILPVFVAISSLLVLIADVLSATLFTRPLVASPTVDSNA